MRNKDDETIIETYGKMVYSIAMNYVCSRYDADDVYSETFLKYFRRVRRFNSEEHRKAYIIRIAVNCSKDFLSDRKRNLTGFNDMLVSEKPEDESVYQLREALKFLDPDDRNLIYLFYYQNMKSAEIAELLKISDSNVRTRLKRAREKLRVLMSH